MLLTFCTKTAIVQNIWSVDHFQLSVTELKLGKSIWMLLQFCLSYVWSKKACRLEFRGLLLFFFLQTCLCTEWDSIIAPPCWSLSFPNNTFLFPFPQRCLKTWRTPRTWLFSISATIRFQVFLVRWACTQKKPCGTCFHKVCYSIPAALTLRRSLTQKGCCGSDLVWLWAVLMVGILVCWIQQYSTHPYACH